jgi:hypothetical protein
MFVTCLWKVWCCWMVRKCWGRHSKKLMIKSGKQEDRKWMNDEMAVYFRYLMQRIKMNWIWPSRFFVLEHILTRNRNDCIRFVIRNKDREVKLHVTFNWRSSKYVTVIDNFQNSTTIILCCVGISFPDFFIMYIYLSIKEKLWNCLTI